MRAVEAFRRANRPGPPEHSVLLRVAATGAVVVGIVACQVQGELTAWFAAIAIALVVAGNAFSHLRRRRSFPYLKLLLAAGMLGAFAWFFVTVSKVASVGDLGSVEAPLAALFAAMQTAHAFDVPTRRDLGFSLAGSAALVAVAAAQAVDLAFGVLVLVWAMFVLAGLLATWRSMAGGAGLRPTGIAAAVGGTLAVGALVLALAPAPRPASGLVLPSSYGNDGATAQPSHLVPASRSSAPQAASASGPTGVGGFLGFAGPLDTAVRASLGNEVVLRVRADRPTFWIAETFDRWSGQSWSERPPGGHAGRAQVSTVGPPFAVPASAAGLEGPSRGRAGPAPDYQTFYLAAPGSDLVLHANRATAVWYPTHRISVTADGTIQAATPLGAGSVYTVLSTVDVPTAAQLTAASGPGAAGKSGASGASGGSGSPGAPGSYGASAGLTPSVATADLQLPHHYPRVAALALRITAGSRSTYAKVGALERWIGSHTRYTLDIPPLRRGQDTVDQFLFHTRRGYCEQISSSLAVMLRTLGIPAREATGYVPGPYDPITDLYEVQAKDAHAWVQVWFPGYGWQSFDPTASVPTANPSPPRALGDAILAALRRLPLAPSAAVLAALVALALLLRWRVRRPATWRAAVTRHLERAARRAGVAVEPGDTLGTLATHLDTSVGDGLPVAPADLALAAERAAWGGHEPEPAVARAIVADARRVHRAVRRSGHRARRSGHRARRRGHGDSRARSPSSQAAPAARSGRNAMS